MANTGKVIACSAAYGGGGLGQHFAQVVDEARAQGVLARYYTYHIKPGDDAKGVAVPHAMDFLTRFTPFRYSPAWRNYIGGELFDKAVAARLSGPHHTFAGFPGKTLRSFQRARALGYDTLELIAVNTHVRNVQRLHDQAYADWGMQRSWLNGAQIRKTLHEYEAADVIWVHSEYTRQSFIDEGIPEAKLKRMYLPPDARFVPPASKPNDGVFRVVYTGSLTVQKGIPVLLEAFSRLDHPRAELYLIGGWQTRATRRYIEAWMAKDPRIRVAPGDPLPHLQQADVYVHPTYEDGYAYAPVEALACGVPVIVTHDTGMKEYVEEGINGFVVPTGRWDAILERLGHYAAAPLSEPLEGLVVEPMPAGQEG